jgi:long-chain acyl-CoA synthetase
LKEFKDFDLKLFGIFSKNSVEYVLLDMAASLFGFTSVPIYDTLGQQAVNYILDQTNVSTIFSSQANVDVLLKLDKFSGLKNVVCLDGFREDQKEKLKAHGLMTIEFSEVMENGKNNSLDYPDYSNETISTFSYTSGTTGDCFNNIK